MKTNETMRNKGKFIAIIIALSILCGIILVVSNGETLSAYAENGIPTYSNVPVFTILTHGLGGSPTNWSNNNVFLSNNSGGYAENEKIWNDYYKQGSLLASYLDLSFSYHENSLIEVLRRKNGNSVVYVLSENSSNLGSPNIDRFDINSGSPTGYSATAVTIPDFSKHCIFVYNSVYDFDDALNTVYGRFKTTVNAVANKYSAQNSGVIPKMNLIGHSRGTMVNLKYATEYTDRIDSMFALGGLFNGSAIGRLVYGLSLEDNLGDNALSNTLGSGFVEDMSNSTLTDDLRAQWNSAITNKSIKAYAVASTFDLDFFKAIINSQEWSNAAKTAAKGAISLIKMAIKVANYGLLRSGILTLIEEVILKNAFPAGYTDNFDAIISDIYSTINGNLVFLTDGFLEESTQAATAYNGFNRMYRRYSDNSDLSKISQSGPRFPHNLETQDSYSINYIAGRISMGVSTPVYDYSVKTDNTIAIERMNYVSGLSDTLTIPSTLDNKTVTEIRDYAFANNCNQNNVSAIVIPSTVTKIENNAFADGGDITSISFASDSNLVEIGDNAFANCSSLTSISLPQSITKIGDYAFYGCDGLTEITIPQYVTEIGYNAFVGCDSLTSISVGAGNTAYSSNQGVLYQIGESNTLLLYPKGKTDTSYTVPANVSEVAPYALSGNSYLSSINLSNVVMLRAYAMEDCENLATISGTNLYYVEENALLGTAWLDNYNTSNPFVALGGALIKYNGTSSVVDLDGYVSVGPFAFAGNTTLTEVLSGDDMVDIGSYAFSGCSALTKVTLNRQNQMIFIGTAGFSDNASGRVIYVPYERMNEYQANELWAQYADDLSVHTTAVTYNSLGGSTCASGTVNYCSYFGTLPSPTRTGYNFAGWYDNPSYTGSAYTSNTYWTGLDASITLYAKWDIITYNMYYHANLGTVSPAMDTYTIESGLTFAVPTRTGYTFSGWYFDNGTFLLPAGTGIDVGTILTESSIYAKWTANIYMVTLTVEEGLSFPNIPRNCYVTFGQSYDFESLYREGYFFMGWRYMASNVYVTDECGYCAEWNIAENITLIAGFRCEFYYIKYTKDTNEVVWLQSGTGGGTPIFDDIQRHIFFGELMDYESCFNDIFEELVNTNGKRFTHFHVRDITPGGPHNAASEEEIQYQAYLDNLFSTWLAAIPDMGEDGHIYELDPQMVDKSYDFTINYCTPGITNITLSDIDFSEQFFVPDIPARTGYDFISFCVESIYVDDSGGEGTLSISNAYIGTTITNNSNVPDYCLGYASDAILNIRAIWQAKTTSVSFSSEHGTIPINMNICYDTTVTLPILSAPGYDFLGWFNSEGTQFSGSNGILLDTWNQIALQYTLIAHWNIIEYQINFTLNGGINPQTVPTSYTVASGIITLPTPTKSGYRFMGWYNNAQFSGNPILTINSGTTGHKFFYSKWAQIYTISFNANGGSACSAITGISGDKIVLPTSTKAGYNGKWNGLTFGTVYSIVNSTTLSATWTEKTLAETGNQIYTAGQLNAVRNASRSATFNLRANITLSGNWTPISGVFTGVFNGNNNKISNMNIAIENTQFSELMCYGLFAQSSGTIKKLYLENVYIYGSPQHNGNWVYAGGVVGRNLPGGTVELITVTGQIELHRQLSSIGGIVGYNMGDITGCSFGSSNCGISSVIGNGDMGGIAGTSVENAGIWIPTICNATVNHYLTGGGRSIGGIVGYCYKSTLSFIDAYGICVKNFGQDSGYGYLCPKMGLVAGHIVNPNVSYVSVTDSNYDMGSLSSSQRGYCFNENGWYGYVENV